MRTILVRLAKGVIVMRLEVWRSNLKHALLAESDAMRAKLKAEMLSSRQAAAMKQISMIMARVMKGVKAGALAGLKMGYMEEVRDREMRRMEHDFDLQIKAASVRELRALIVRLVKGQTAMHIEIWRTNMTWSAMQSADALRAALEAEMKTGQIDTAVKQLQTTFARMMRGEKAMALQARMAL